MFEAFPLQHKKMSRLLLPFLDVGVCEVMNCSTRDHMSSFTVHNTHNRGLYSGGTNSDAGTSSSSSMSSVPFMSEVVAGGLCDSFTGNKCSRFIGNYLCRALGVHSVLPNAIAQLRRELKDDPIIDLMMSLLACERLIHRRNLGKDINPPRVFRHVFSEWEMQQYAMFADNAFIDACRKEESFRGLEGNEALRNSETANSGCRAVWFTATVSPFALHEQRRERRYEVHRGDVAPSSSSVRWEERDGGGGGRNTRESKDSVKKCDITSSMTPFCLDVLISNVGDSRAFGIARHKLSSGICSPLDSSRERLVPLTSDHRPLRSQELRRILSAGGVVRSKEGNIIDGNPFFNVSRSFGHWSMKCNSKRPPSEQKIIAMPECSSWDMLPGDVLVLCNHAIFETRCEEESSMDEIAKAVGREIDRGTSPEEVAAVVCDYAIRFGSKHSLQVMVAVATEDNADHTFLQETKKKEWVVPGPIYAEPCRRLPEYRKALQIDCERCGVSLAELLELRWRQVKNILPCRHALPLMAHYGKECSALQQIMDEEAILFGHEALLSLPPLASSEDDTLSEENRAWMAKTFEKMAKSLVA